MKELYEHHGRIEGYDILANHIIDKIKEIILSHTKEELHDTSFIQYFQIDTDKEYTDNYDILESLIKRYIDKDFFFILTNKMPSSTCALINAKEGYMKINAKDSYDVIVDHSKDISSLKGTIIHEFTHYIDLTKRNYKHYFLGGDSYDVLEFENPINHEKIDIRRFLNPEIKETIEKLLYRFDPSEIKAYISENIDVLQNDEYTKKFFNQSKYNKNNNNKGYSYIRYNEIYDSISSIIKYCGTGLIFYMDTVIQSIENDTYKKYKDDFLRICKNNTNSEYQTSSIIFSLICYCQTYRKYCHIKIPNRLLVNEDEYNQYKYKLLNELTNRRRKSIQKISKTVYDFLEDQIDEMNKDSFKIYANNEIKKDYIKSKKSLKNIAIKSMSRVYKSIYNIIKDI